MSNKFDAIYPISTFKRNFNSVMRRFESKKWTHVLITRNGKPIAHLIPPSPIQEIDCKDTKKLSFNKEFGDCVILTHDNKILLQRRTIAEKDGMFALNIFGGLIEKGESPIDGMIRELNEETGAILHHDDVTFIGAVTEEFTHHKELIHVYFWHDKNNSITGCYEWEAVHFDTAEQAINQPEIMDYAIWAIKKCQSLGLLK